MKKIIAVLIAGTFIIGTAVAQTGTAPAAKPAEKKETAAPAQKPAEKKDAMGTPKPEVKKKHHKGGKGKKAETATPEKK